MEYVILDQQLIPKSEASINFDDRGYYFGDGIYEVVKIYNGQPFAMEMHLDRFRSSSEKLDIAFPMSNEQLSELLMSLLQKNSIDNGLIYFQITRGVEPRNHLYTRQSAPVLTAFTQATKDVATPQEKGLTVWLTDDIRWLRCDIKTINLLGNVLVKREAADHHCHEAILNRDGIMTEGSSSNLFLVKDNVLYTHPATNLILNGITRQLVIKLAKENNYSVVEEPFPVEVLEHADEAFITSSSVEIAPITAVKGQLTTVFDIGPVTLHLQKKFAEILPK
ncbi:D-amino-acid transaminase [Halalkalibacter akibai]|uniref:D-alanine aminotransferase n=1 Tax=Halalkalibacter akibai (strain ATCC 43226 / DSM 21942 / CIP 109018 / JCM 9157 / 1139) TaxID=1236973 RepID=W4QW36_HALA3|nr:D-amino-acid transaminase [Halalkalibacter akibai]GAE36321.1 D-alanine aminotransferase [Halalkalibacter akibai JCM 9157]